MTNPIYKPKGKAGEYGDYAINIYDSCNHGCTYCYARQMAARFGRPWGDTPTPRDGILEATQRQLASGGIEDKLIHLCFTCDPYPSDVDTSITREIIKAIKDSGNHVQILTKNADGPFRDFDLLDKHDWIGATVTGGGYDLEPNASPEHARIYLLAEANRRGIKTWVSHEPVYDVYAVYATIINDGDFIDLYKIGKTNYHPSDIDWGAFGRECERLCKEYGRNYYIKDDLWKCMEAGT